MLTGIPDVSIDLPAIRLDGAHMEYGRPANGVIDASFGNDILKISTHGGDGGGKAGKTGR